MRNIMVQDTSRTRRVPRNPTYRSQIRSRPWQLVPFMCAPVLPGETLKNIRYQSRSVTDPILNPLVGWHKETYFFYIKHRQLDVLTDGFGQALQDMMLTYDKDMSAYNSSADAKYYHQSSSINFTKHCLYAVVKWYFRAEGEGVDDFTLDGYPSASIKQECFWDSFLADDNMPHGGSLTGNAETMESVDVKMQAYDFMRANGLINMSYEDYLATYGVQVAKAADPERPEVIRYHKEWQYPSNTIDPTDGSPRSAVSWSDQVRADKDRFFTEPGFILGVQVHRPKVYLANQASGLVDYLDDAFAWLPALMRDDPQTSLRKFTDTVGPAGTVITDDEGYWLDLRDLFLWGDQFVNFDIGADDTGSSVALPTAGGRRRYPSATDALNLFVDQTTSKWLIRTDAVTSLTVMGTQQDTTGLTKSAAT